MSSFDPRRVWLEELLALPHLWPEQVAQVRVLAAECGVEVVFLRYGLNEPELGWQEVQGVAMADVVAGEAAAGRGADGGAGVSSGAVAAAAAWPFLIDVPY